MRVGDIAKEIAAGVFAAPGHRSTEAAE
jgi:hypothetical protein